MDGALVTAAPQAAEGWTPQGRFGFNYERRRGSVLAERTGERLIICKGAPEALLAVCDRRRDGEVSVNLDDESRDTITA